MIGFEFLQNYVQVSLEYEPTNVSLVSALSWDLAVRMRGAPAQAYTEDSCCIRTPALRGNVVAVRRKLFKELGGYDVVLAAELNDAGHNVELSLRAWMCGLDIYTVPCSRVGVLNLRDPVKVSRIFFLSCKVVLVLLHSFTVYIVLDGSWEVENSSN